VDTLNSAAFNVNGNCQYRIKIWPLNSGQEIVAQPALWDKSKIHLPALCIKLGLIKITAKAMDK